MPGTNKRSDFDKVEYAAATASSRFASRHVLRYRADNGVAGSNKRARSFPIALAARHDGQSLAGSGALVFEGELLEAPRQ